MLNIDQTMSVLQNKFEVEAERLEKKALWLAVNEAKIASLPNWLKMIYNFFHSESKRMMSFSAECRRLLDEIEKVPTIFSEDITKLVEQKKYYASCLKTLKIAFSLLSKVHSKDIKTQAEDISLKISGLQYRIEAVNGGLPRLAVNSELLEQLSAAALLWKQNQILIIKKEVTSEETKKLEEVSTYPEFVKILLSSKRLQDTFFNWSLRDNNQISQFIEFPCTAARLKSVYLSSRTGKLPGMCRIQKLEKDTGISEKVVTLAFSVQNQVVHTSILDEEQELHLDGGPVTTIGKVLDCFSKKNREIGEFEAFLSGIRYWNCHHVGSIDFNPEQWWKQLPIVEEISRQQLEERSCGILNDEEWVVFARSSTTTPDMDLDGRHGFFDVAIPTGTGTYAIYPFGIFPSKFPNTAIETALFLGNTFKAKISYPDENFFYAHRQQASFPIPLTEPEAHKFMKILQKELILSRYDNQIFQFGAENCAYWAQKVLSHVNTQTHNFFKTDYSESYPLNPFLKLVWKIYRCLPLAIRNFAIKCVDIIFGSYRSITVFERGKRVRKSHRTSHVREQFVIYNPYNLHRQIRAGVIQGRVYMGNC